MVAVTARYVVLGLARPRTPWFGEVGAWSAGGATPVDFVRCLTAEEVRARLAGGQRISALLVDSRAPGLDRDVLNSARRADVAVIVVDDGAVDRDWHAIGATAVLPAPFVEDDLVALLADHAPAVPPTPLPGPGADGPTERVGRLIAVTGSGGSGTSVLAMALAQHLGGRTQGDVLLADLALDADQAMLHAAPDVVPGLTDLVESHRLGTPDPSAVRSTTFEVHGRHYRLLLGLHRHRDWADLRPANVAATVDSLLREFPTVVVDVDADVEGARDCGVVEVEERNVLARTVLGRAEVVIVVGNGGTKGIHALTRTLQRLAAFGVEPTRTIPVLNGSTGIGQRWRRAPQAIDDLVAEAGDDLRRRTVTVPWHRGVEAALRDGGPLPRALGAPLAAALATTASAGRSHREEPVPVPAVAPGRPG